MSLSLFEDRHALLFLHGEFDYDFSDSEQQIFIPESSFLGESSPMDPVDGTFTEILVSFPWMNWHR